MSDDLAYTSATELVEAYREKRLSPVEATRAVLDRISAHNDAINAYLLIDEEGALRAAAESEARWAAGAPKGLVDGVPTGIKDLILTKGWPTLRGSKTVDRDQPWDEDAPAVARLREHGAVILGKTATPEFGWKGVTDSPLSGITRNPWNLEKTPGGSSGGASAALAAGMGQLQIGTDGGGSVRIPSSFAGVFGLKPGFGRVPAYPASPMGTLAHVGPMTRTVADAALMLDVIAEGDGRDWLALPHDGRDWRDGIEGGVEGLKVAFSPTLGYAEVDGEVASLVAEAAARFEEMGARVEETDPGFDNPSEVFRTHWWAGAAHAMRGLTPERMELLDKAFAHVVREGGKISLADYMDAVDKRTVLAKRMSLFLETYDLLLTPALAVPAFDVGRLAPDDAVERDWVGWTPFTIPFNLSQQPACSIPCGFTAEGLPVGLQIVGPRYREDLVLRAARAYEAAHPLSDRRPSL